MSGGAKLMLGGLLCAVLGIVWTFAWQAWGDLWDVVKGGIGLLLLALALISLALGLVQVHEDRDGARPQEKEESG